MRKKRNAELTEAAGDGIARTRRALAASLISAKNGKGEGGRIGPAPARRLCSLYIGLAEPDDRDFAVQRALVGGGMRLFGGHFGQHADLVEIGFDEAFLGERVQGFAYGAVVIGGF